MDQGEARQGEENAAEPGRWTVTAAPFTRAARLRAFIAAVAAIEGVTELVAERFRLGELSLSLRYAGTQSLAGCLAALPEFLPQVEAELSGAIRVVLGEGGQDS